MEFDPLQPAASSWFFEILSLLSMAAVILPALGVMVVIAFLGRTAVRQLIGRGAAAVEARQSPEHRQRSIETLQH